MRGMIAKDEWAFLCCSMSRRAVIHDRKWIIRVGHTPFSIYLRARPTLLMAAGELCDGFENYLDRRFANVPILAKQHGGLLKTPRSCPAGNSLSTSTTGPLEQFLHLSTRLTGLPPGRLPVNSPRLLTRNEPVFPVTIVLLGNPLGGASR